jgi:hypothetical protein
MEGEEKKDSTERIFGDSTWVGEVHISPGPFFSFFVRRFHPSTIFTVPYINPQIRKVNRGDANMKETLRLELLGSAQLIISARTLFNRQESRLLFSHDKAYRS